MSSRSKFDFIARLTGIGSIVAIVASCSGDLRAVTNPELITSAVTASGANDSRPSLAVITAPAGAVAGFVFATQPQLEFRTGQGKLIPAGVHVTASLVGTDVVLGGTTVVSAERGVATFSDLRIPTAGTYTMEFRVPGSEPVMLSVVVEAFAGCVFDAALVDDELGISVSGSIATVEAPGGTFVVDVTVTPAECTWTPIVNRSWIDINQPGLRTGSGSFTYNVEVLPHSAASRTGTITLEVSGPALGVRTFTINQIHQ
jgi:hypothetical protein